MGLLKKPLGTSPEKELRAIKPIVDKIGALDGEYSKFTDEQLKAKTPEFKQRIANGKNPDDILPEAFAACREAAWRVPGMKPYRVQFIGGIILHQGRIAEMKTGEGKTLVATLPAYLNTLVGEGVYIVTVNDYLARRDSERMGKVYRFLGLTVGPVIHGIQPKDRKASYAANITYGTNNKFGLDYLRDNMVIHATETVQRGHVFVIVDEVDSIPIDEAHTPLIIPGQGDKSIQLYTVVDAFVAKLKGQRVASVDTKEEEDPGLDADCVMDERVRTVTLTAQGVAKVEQQLQVANLADPENTTLSYHINQVIRARGLMRRDIDYVVKDGEVIIVDEFTGRLMHGRRYPEGLHQAIEAKEGVTVARESKILVTITFQNYSRLHDKLSGTAGTAMIEEEGFGTIRSLDIVEILTNKPVQCVDHPDMVYKTEAGKFRAIVNQIEECHKKGQPVLVGTTSIEKSEKFSAMLKKRGVRHNVFNARFHEKEAETVAQTGKLGAVTMATGMAGRGTDIMLGGNAEYLAKAELRKAGLSDELIAESAGYADTDNKETLNTQKMFAEVEAKYKDEVKAEAGQVRAAGGLFILDTERHESRRIDNQLRGRAGRQGDLGESRFYLSLEDDIMRLLGSERVMGMMGELGVDEDTPTDAKILSNAIENAQRQVESRNFQTRKTVLEYNDVMNTQCKVIYEQRRKVSDGKNLKEPVQTMPPIVISTKVQVHMGELKHMDVESQREACVQLRGLFLRPDEFKFTDEKLQQYDAQALTDLLQERASDIYARKEAGLGESLMRELERAMMPRVVDECWMNNISAVQELRQGIGLRAHGQNDPVVAYKKEGYEMFGGMIAVIQAETTRCTSLAWVQVGVITVKREWVVKITGESAGSDGTVKRQPVKKGQEVGRNDPCPCGSGKKYKKCCGMHEDEQKQSMGYPKAECDFAGT